MKQMRQDVVAFEDASGVNWTVRELSLASMPAHPSGKSLVFESAKAVRRVWSYPPEWRDLSATELEALSWST